MQSVQRDHIHKEKNPPTKLKAHITPPLPASLKKVVEVAKSLPSQKMSDANTQMLIPMMFVDKSASSAYLICTSRSDPNVDTNEKKRAQDNARCKRKDQCHYRDNVPRSHVNTRCKWGHR